MALLPGTKGAFGSPEYELDRKATELKKAGDLPGAIAALRERKALMGQQWQDDKLAKYLQAAGQFDEAMAEIDWLLAHSHAWAREHFAHQPASVLLKQRTQRRSRIHASGALICKRASRPDIQALHERERNICLALIEKISPVAEADQRARSDSWNAASEQGRQATHEYIQARKAATARNLQLGQTP